MSRPCSTLPPSYLGALSVSSWPEERRGSVLRPPLAGHCARGRPARALCPDTIIIALMIALEKRIVIGWQAPSSGRPLKRARGDDASFGASKSASCNRQQTTPSAAAGIKVFINRAGCVRGTEETAEGKENRGWENSFRGTRRSISDRQGEQLETNYRKK